MKAAPAAMAAALSILIPLVSVDAEEGPFAMAMAHDCLDSTDCPDRELCISLADCPAGEHCHTEPLPPGAQCGQGQTCFCSQICTARKHCNFMPEGASPDSDNPDKLSDDDEFGIVMIFVGMGVAGAGLCLIAAIVAPCKKRELRRADQEDSGVCVVSNVLSGDKE
mmetsp:Transcript_36947/g.106616  ORF Transcript_36947/g.106616 Transcript_36947/m.106616 type:complete len:166 (-) Transcript_36947:85-582(-)